MLKRLLLTAALLSSTYGELEYFDPDFSLLANRSDNVVVNEEGVVIKLYESESWVLLRLTTTETSETLSSKDPNVLDAARSAYNHDIWCIKVIYTTLTSDLTLHNGYSKEQDAAFLSRLFWSRVSLLEQLVQVMLLSPQIITDDPTGTLKQHYEKLTAFCERYDQTDATPFIKGHHKEQQQLMDEFVATLND